MPTGKTARTLQIAALGACISAACALATRPATAHDPRPSGETRAQALSRDLDESRCTALVCAAEEIGPSVVSVGAERTTYVRWPGGSGFDSMFFPFLYEERLREMPYLGSGIAIDADGHIVTNYHVVQDARRVFVTLADKRKFDARLVDYDPINDIAILKIDAENLRPAKLGDSDDVRLGEWVLAIGNPYGAMLDDPTPTITAGVVSALDRFLLIRGRVPKFYEGMIQTDASINPGNSGGALVNAAGEVIGVNTFIFTESGGSVGIGFAIPINKVKRAMDEIREHGRLRQARLDFQAIDITPYVQRAVRLPSREGVLVYSVEPDGPAHKAGIEPGDVIRQVNARRVDSRSELLVHVLATPVGESVELLLQREGRSLKTKYTVQERQRR